MLGVRSTGRFTAIDLFSGCGGLTAGLRMAGFRVCAAVEVERKARITYQLNHRGVKLYGKDIRSLPAATVLKETGLKAGQLDLLAGCPPCQGYSRLRTRNKRSSVKDPRNALIADFLRFVRALKPKTIMLENVPALKEDSRFKLFCRELVRLKYKYVQCTLNAEDYGVPQRRRRLILLASRVHNPATAKRNPKKITVRQALRGLESPSRTDDEVHAVPERRTDAVKELIRHVPKNGGSRSDLPARFQLECHKKQDGFYDIYGRMSWDLPAPTITSGCINPSKGRFLHPALNRTITLREAAILQGFPRRYSFDVSHGKEAIALMIGNALPPPFIAAHARTLRQGIAKARNQGKDLIQT